MNICKDCHKEGNYSTIIGDIKKSHYYLCKDCSAKRSRNAFFTPEAQKQQAFLKSLKFNR